MSTPVIDIQSLIDSGQIVSYPGGRKLRTISYEKLRNATIKNFYKVVAEYNKLGGFAKGDKRRIKDGECRTMCSILTAWAAQAAEEANTVAYLNNIVYTNNAKMQSNTGRDKRTSARHVAKLAGLGFLMGREATEKDPACFQLKSGGYGVVPAKEFHGSKSDFGLLINPHLIGIEVFHDHMEIDYYDCFPIQNTLSPRDMVTKSLHKEKLKGNVNVNILAKRAFATLTSSCEDDLREIHKAEEVFSESQAQSLHPGVPQLGSKPSEIPEKATEKVSIHSKAHSIQHDESLFRKLMMAGKAPAAFAVMLVRMYLARLGPNMRLANGDIPVYAPACIIRATESAAKLLSLYEDPETGFDRASEVILHMEKRLKYKQDMYLLPPSRWFDATEKYGIVYHATHYLKPWKERAESFKTKSEVPKTAKNKLHSTDWAAISPYHEFAAELHEKLIRLNPWDYRLKTAQIDKWAKTVRLTVERDGIALPRLQEISSWMLNSSHPQARFWRSEAGGRGIRSASGIRKQFQSIQNGFIQANKTHTNGK